MSGDSFFFAEFVILDTNCVDVHVIGFAGLRVDGFDGVLEIQKGFVVLSEGGIDVAGDAVSVFGVSSACCFLFTFLVFVEVVDGFLQRFGSLYFRVAGVGVGVGDCEGGSGLHLVQATASFEGSLLLLRKGFCVFAAVGSDVLFQNCVFVLPVHLYLRLFETECLSVIQILGELSFDAFPSVFEVEFGSFSVVECGGVGLIELRLVFQGVGLDVVGLHEVAVADAALFGAAVAIGFRAGSVVELLEGRVGEGAGVGYLFLDVFFN